MVSDPVNDQSDASKLGHENDSVRDAMLFGYDSVRGAMLFGCFFMRTGAYIMNCSYATIKVVVLRIKNTMVYQTNHHDEPYHLVLTTSL